MSDYCEKCKRCHDDCLRDDEECIYYGEPNGCNHPNHGYGVIVDKYEALQKENAELREFVKLIVNHYPVACEGEKYHCNWKQELPIERMKAALEGGNDAND